MGILRDDNTLLSSSPWVNHWTPLAPLLVTNTWGDYDYSYVQNVLKQLLSKELLTFCVPHSNLPTKRLTPSKACLSFTQLPACVGLSHSPYYFKTPCLSDGPVGCPQTIQHHYVSDRGNWLALQKSSSAKSNEELSHSSCM